jgi:hypothetical protein
VSGHPFLFLEIPMHQVRPATRRFAAACAGLAALALCATPAWSACTPPQNNGRAAHAFRTNEGLVFAATTNLTWQRCSVGQQFEAGACHGTPTHLDWAAAQQAATAAGNGWRLPTQAELQSLLLSYCSAPAIDTAVFPQTAAAWYWSSSTDGAQGAWFVDFQLGGGGGATLRSSTAAVRLVRSGAGS